MFTARENRTFVFDARCVCGRTETVVVKYNEQKYDLEANTRVCSEGEPTVDKIRELFPRWAWINLDRFIVRDYDSSDFTMPGVMVCSHKCAIEMITSKLEERLNEELDEIVDLVRYGNDDGTEITG